MISGRHEVLVQLLRGLRQVSGKGLLRLHEEGLPAKALPPLGLRLCWRDVAA